MPKPRSLARSVVRSAPSLLVASLVVLAARAQTAPQRAAARAQASSMAAASAPIEPRRDGEQFPSSCTYTAASVPFTDLVPMPSPDATVYQPRAITVSAIGASLALELLVDTPVEVAVSYFDPDASDPLLGTVPLERTIVTGTAGPPWINWQFSRPIVTRKLDQDPYLATATAAISASTPGSTIPAAVAFSPDGGPPNQPPAGFLTALGYAPLPGPSPALGHQVCGSIGDDASLRVLQEVLRCNTTIGATATAEVVQSFRVPVTVTAEWVELALPAPPLDPAPPLEVRILDAAGQSMPPPGPLPVTTTAATRDVGPPGSLNPPVWISTLRLQEAARLVPGTTYWLAVIGSNRWSLHADASPGGTDYPDGVVFRRPASTGNFLVSSLLDLSFRLIGTGGFPDPGPPPACNGSVLSQWVSLTDGFRVHGNDAILHTVTLTSDGRGVSSLAFPTHAPGPESSDLHVSFHVPGPLGLDPSSIALASTTVTKTSQTQSTIWRINDLERTIAPSNVTGTATESGAELAFQILVPVGATFTAEFGYDGNGNATATATRYRDGSGTWQPLPGQHPILTHSICGPPATARDLRAIQQVTRMHGAITSTAAHDVIQKLRVPTTGEVDWAELAVLDGESPGGAPVTMELIAPYGNSPLQGEDLGGVTIATATADWDDVGRWDPTTLTATFKPATLFPTTVTLTPGVDYWLRIVSAGRIGIPTATADTYPGGRAFGRASAQDPMSEIDADLAFRLIGATRPLMATGKTTQTCCFEAIGTTLTSTHGLPPGIKRVAQGIVMPESRPIGSLQIPVGVDGAAVTFTAAVAFDRVLANGLHVPRDDTYPVVSTRTSTDLDMTWRSSTFTRPIVVESVTQTAEPSSNVAQLVLEQPVVQGGRLKIGIGPPATVTLTAVERRAGTFTWEQVEGPPAMMGHVVTPPSETAELRATQQILRIEGEENVTVTTEWVQTFRVPVTSTAEWVELALPQQTPTPIQVGIFDPGPLLEPSSGAINVTVTSEAFDPVCELLNVWGGSLRFQSPPTLVPGKEYWLVVTTPAGARLGVGNVTATAQGEHRLFRRVGGQPWVQRTDRDLAYRIIGTPQGVVGVRPDPRPGVFTLRAEPMPFSHELALRWSGGEGRTRIEIYDVHGRVVRRVPDAGPAAEGAWVWRGEDQSGRRMRAGVYFARVIPATGRVLERRIVFVH